MIRLTGVQRGQDLDHLFLVSTHQLLVMKAVMLLGFFAIRLAIPALAIGIKSWQKCVSRSCKGL